MSGLAPVDSVDVQVLVDNVTDSLSTVPAGVETEFAGLAERLPREDVLLIALGRRFGVMHLPVEGNLGQPGGDHRKSARKDGVGEQE